MADYFEPKAFDHGKKELLAKRLAAIQAENKSLNISNGVEDHSVFPSGVIEIDHVLGIGGFPRAGVIEISGSESSGKTTLALQLAGAIQRISDGATVFIEFEPRSLPSAERLKNLGMTDIENRVIRMQNAAIEDIMPSLAGLIATGAVDCVIIDSIAAGQPRIQIEDAGGMDEDGRGKRGDNGEYDMAIGRAYTQALRELSLLLEQHQTLLIGLNQQRISRRDDDDDVDTVHDGSGSPLRIKTPGGNAWRFYSSLRLSLQRTDKTITDGRRRQIGEIIQATVIKNKFDAPGRTTDLDLVYNTGFSNTAGLIALAKKFGHLTDDMRLSDAAMTALNNCLEKLQRAPLTTNRPAASHQFYDWLNFERDLSNALETFIRAEQKFRLP